MVSRSNPIFKSFAIAVVFWFFDQAFGYAVISTETREHLARRVLEERRISQVVFMELWTAIQNDLGEQGKFQDDDLRGPVFDRPEGFDLRDPTLDKLFNLNPHHIHPHIVQLMKEAFLKKSASPFFSELFDSLKLELESLESKLLQAETASSSVLETNRKRAQFQQRLDELKSYPNRGKVFSELQLSLEALKGHISGRMEYPAFVRAGYAEAHGRKSSERGSTGYMEDRILLPLATDSVSELKDVGIQNFAVFSVFDGHCGEWVADRAHALFRNTVKDFLLRLTPEEIQTPDRVRVALEAALNLPGLTEDLQRPFEGLRDLNLRLFAEGIAPGEGPGSRKLSGFPGSTVVAAIFLDGRVYFVNLGDSRAHVLFNDQRIERMTRDHRPLEEADAVVKAGGYVNVVDLRTSPFKSGEPTEVFGTPRVDGDLSLSRSLGDWYLKGVGRSPDVTFLDLDVEGVQAIVLQSDGIHESIKADSHLAEIIKKNFSAEYPAETANRVLRHAYDLGSYDNLSVMILVPLR